MKSQLPVVLTLAAITFVVASGPHTSASYTVQPAVLNAGGGRSSSASYTHDASLTDIAGAGSAGAYSAGHGYIAQIISDPAGCPVFLAWQTTHFGSPSNPLAAPAADPDNDGADNAAEFAFNLNPDAPDAVPLTPAGASGLPLWQVENIEGRDRYTVTFVRRTACLSYTIEVSRDLQTWDQPEFQPVGSSIPLPGGWERVKFADREPFPGLNRRYLRLSIKL